MDASAHIITDVRCFENSVCFCRRIAFGSTTEISNFKSEISSLRSHRPSPGSTRGTFFAFASRLFSPFEISNFKSEISSLRSHRPSPGSTRGTFFAFASRLFSPFDISNLKSEISSPQLRARTRFSARFLLKFHSHPNQIFSCPHPLASPPFAAARASVRFARAARSLLSWPRSSRSRSGKDDA
jgi:hypothetical protein